MDALKFDSHLFLFSKQVSVNLMMIMKELMLQRKRRMMKRIHSLTPVIFYHRVLLKVTSLVSEHHHSLRMMKGFFL